MRKNIVALVFLVLSQVLIAEFKMTPSIYKPDRVKYNAVIQERINKVIDHVFSVRFVEGKEGTHPKKPKLRFSRPFNVSLSARAFLNLTHRPNKDGESSEYLKRVGQYYLDHPDEISNPDSSYWAGEYHTMSLAQYGKFGTVRRAAIDKQSEEIMLKYMWAYVNYWSRIDQYDLSEKYDTFVYWNSENHWWQEVVTSWGYLSVLRTHSEYADKALRDGSTVKDHFRRTEEYMKEHMQQRARKGFMVEISTGGYAGRMHAMYSLIYTISEDAVLRKLAAHSMDLYWAFWAEEQIGGERGGGKVRHRNFKGLKPNSETHMFVAWVYFGIGQNNLEWIKSIDDDKLTNILSSKYFYLCSGYAPPSIVHQIVVRSGTKGPYEIIQRRLGKVNDQIQLPKRYTEAVLKTKIYDVINGDCLKYSWRDENYILGTIMRPPKTIQYWEPGSAQAWWHGLLIKGDNTVDRVVPTLAIFQDHFGTQYSIQSKESFMCRKLPDRFNKKNDNTKHDMGIFISNGLLQYTEHDEEFVTIQSPQCWVVIRAAQGGFKIKKGAFEKQWNKHGQYFSLENDMSPLIIETRSPATSITFNSFKDLVVSSKLDYKDGVYQYASLSGDEFIMYDDRTRPKINGKTIDYSPSMSYDSPHVKSKWDSGLIELVIDDQKLLLDFMN